MAATAGLAVAATAALVAAKPAEVILDLDPGALRELHWHPTADEWHYVIDGDISVTMFGSGGR